MKRSNFLATLSAIFLAPFGIKATSLAPAHKMHKCSSGFGYATSEDGMTWTKVLASEIPDELRSTGENCGGLTIMNDSGLNVMVVDRNRITPEQQRDFLEAFASSQNL